MITRLEKTPEELKNKKRINRWRYVNTEWTICDYNDAKDYYWLLLESNMWNDKLFDATYLFK
jgi:hypothetical protein